MEKIALVTGGFDPIHSGHISYLQAARERGERLIVGVNSDAWLTRKKGAPFMPWSERAEIVRNLRCVDEVIDFNDDDGSAKDAILKVRAMYPQATIHFCNGGDRLQDNIPEMDVADDNIYFEFGTGGFNKANSSSWILREWKAPKTDRAWGYYRVLHEDTGVKVKELTVEPGQKLSMQKHFKRSEYWMVAEGRCVVYKAMESGYMYPPTNLELHDTLDIDCEEWHQLANPYDKPCKIVEIQYGQACDEDDIVRREAPVDK